MMRHALTQCTEYIRHFKKDHPETYGSWCMYTCQSEKAIAAQLHMFVVR